MFFFVCCVVYKTVGPKSIQIVLIHSRAQYREQAGNMYDSLMIDGVSSASNEGLGMSLVRRLVAMFSRILIGRCIYNTFLFLSFLFLVSFVLSFFLFSFLWKNRKNMKRRISKYLFQRNTMQCRSGRRDYAERGGGSDKRRSLRQCEHHC